MELYVQIDKRYVNAIIKIVIKILVRKLKRGLIHATGRINGPMHKKPITKI